MQMLDISVIIVNYNTAELLAACLKSLMAPFQPRMEVIVVDNASNDDSVRRLTHNFSWVKVIANERNLGFSRANNQALKISKGKYVFFLNPDTVVKPGALDAIIAFMETHTDVGLAGTRLVNPDGSLQSSVERRYPGQRRAKQELIGLKGRIAWVLGASMIARRFIVDALGGFDERFFLYGEEQDLCLRIRKAGWKIGFISDAVVVHWGGQSESNTPAIGVWRKKFAAESLFYRIHYSRRSILRIHRANVLQAIWRIFSLKLTYSFCADKKASLAKLSKYKLVLETFRFWKI